MSKTTSIPFYKYQGTGNDFVMIDNRTNNYITRTDTDLVALMCDRKFGIGADGLILLQNKIGYDFEMVYFNADGNESSMCGNGGRCITHFARELGIERDQYKFLAIDGDHEATIGKEDWVDLKMGDVKDVEIGEDYFVLNTGSPHYVVFVEDIDDIKVDENGSAIRYSKRFRKEGINVNFVENSLIGLHVATYERGVEAETLSCGTGVVASAISSKIKDGKGSYEVPIKTKGGDLKVRFELDANLSDGQTGNVISDVWLGGVATLVFRGVFG